MDVARSDRTLRQPFLPSIRVLGVSPRAADSALNKLMIFKIESDTDP
jgi:hypothetical protein